jgi:Protein of unknown function (DUF3485)
VTGTLKRMVLAVAAAMLLLTAVAVQYFRPIDLAYEGSAQVVGKLAEVLPRHLTGGWSGMDLPLGESELLRKRTEALLQFDDYVHRRYANAERSFSIYIAYWKPGKMPPRLVSLHIPDRCWVENGWTCLQSRNRQTSFAAADLPPCEWRIFTAPGSEQKIFTVFWLLVDGRPHEFGSGSNRIPNPFAWWAGVLKEARGDKAAHLFVRITSDRPLENLVQTSAWPEMAAALRQIGLKSRALAGDSDGLWQTVKLRNSSSRGFG